MKTILVTATTVGTAIAGLIIYFRNKNKAGRQMKETTNEANHSISDGIQRLERPALHAMG